MTTQMHTNSLWKPKSLKKLSLYLTQRVLSGLVDDEFIRTSQGLDERLTQLSF